MICLSYIDTHLRESEDITDFMKWICAFCRCITVRVVLQCVCERKFYSFLNEILRGVRLRLFCLGQSLKKYSMA